MALFSRLNIHTINTIIPLSVCMLYTQECHPLRNSVRDVSNKCKCQLTISMRLQLEMFCFNQLILKLKILNQNFPGILRIVSLGTYFIGRLLLKSCVDFNKRVWGTGPFFPKSWMQLCISSSTQNTGTQLVICFRPTLNAINVLNDQQFNQYKKVNYFKIRS